MTNQDQIPAWLIKEEHYEPLSDNDSFVTKSILSVTGVLAHFRLDDGSSLPISPSAPAKLLFCLACILMTSLSSNYLFVLVMLAGVLARMAILPAQALQRVVVLAFSAAAMAFLLTLPAILIGQTHSALLIATKVFVSVGCALCMTLGTPFNQLTAGLRVFHVPHIFIFTIDLALKGIVTLGNVALEVLTALKLRSVGRNREKGRSLGGVAGVLFLKSKDASDETYQAMCCRGFEGEYITPAESPWRLRDLVWLAVLVGIAVLFALLEGIL